MIGDIMQPTHLLFVLVIALLVLGPKRLPEVGRQLGSGLRDFRAAINGERSEREDESRSDSTSSLPNHDAPAQPSESPSEHEFAHAAAEPVADTHTFAHDAAPSVEPEHAGVSEAGSGDAASGTESSAASGGEHEFAHERTSAAETRTDPLS